MASRRIAVAGLLTAVLITTIAQSQAPERGAARRSAPAGAAPASDIPAHNLGELLDSKPLYDLYQYRSYRGWCIEGHAALSIVYKVQPGFAIDLGEEGKARFEREILPAVRARCPNVRQLAVFNFVRGVILSANDEHSYEQAASVRNEQPLSNFQIAVDAQGNLSFPEGEVQYASLADFRTMLANARKGSAASAAARERDRQAVLAAQQKLAATTRSADGLLRLDNIAAEYKALFLQIYNEEFIDLARPDKEHYLPFQMYTALIQGYDKNCRQNLVNPVPVEFHGERLTHTVYGPLFDTEYYETYLKATVYVEKKYEPAYRSAHSMFLNRLGQYYERNLRGENILSFWLMQNTRGIGLAKASHDLIAVNGCKSKGIARFMDTLTSYVSGTWSTRTADGYKYAEEQTSRSIIRRYEGVPSTFSPQFPEYTGREITLYLNDGSGRDGLRFVTIERFSLVPFYLTRREQPGFKPPANVQAALAENRYHVAHCQYVYGNEGRSLFFWSANGPLPGNDLQAYTKGVIEAPRQACPADAR